VSHFLKRSRRSHSPKVGSSPRDRPEATSHHLERRATDALFSCGSALAILRPTPGNSPRSRSGSPWTTNRRAIRQTRISYGSISCVGNAKASSIVEGGSFIPLDQPRALLHRGGERALRASCRRAALQRQAGGHNRLDAGPLRRRCHCVRAAPMIVLQQRRECGSCSLC
jgi:hypothetical protein